MAKKSGKPSVRFLEDQPWWTGKGLDKLVMAKCMRDKALDLQREAQRLIEAARILEGIHPRS